MHTVQKSMNNCSDSTSKTEKTIWYCSFLLLAFVLISFCAPAPGFAWRDKPAEVIEKSCGDNNTAGKKILIAYDTEHGATATITDRIADVLCREGYQVDLSLARNVEDVSGYDGVIAGSPIYMSKWLPEIKAFLKQFKNDLAEKPVALFITCTYLKDSNDTTERRAKAVELYVAPTIESYLTTDPVSIGILSGEFQYAELYPLELFLMKLSGFQEGDFRNWEKIEAWATELADLLK